MAVNPTDSIFSDAFAMHKAGATVKEICAETGLNYSQLWRFCESRSLDEAGFEFLTELAGNEKAVAEMREAGLSWGKIACRFRLNESHTALGCPEGKVRKAFETATGLKSQGQRIGKGGRFFYGYSGQPLYAGELRPTGTDIPVGAKLGEALVAAEEQRMISWDIEAVRAKATELGISLKAGKKNATKAQLIGKIRKALREEATGLVEA